MLRIGLLYVFLSIPYSIHHFLPHLKSMLLSPVLKLRRVLLARTRADPLPVDSGSVSAAVAIPCVTRRSSRLYRIDR
jgi:hypothetical protein